MTVCEDHNHEQDNVVFQGGKYFCTKCATELVLVPKSMIPR